MKTVKLANSVDSDEVAHNEPPHQNLLCLPSSLRILNMIKLGALRVNVKIYNMMGQYEVS